MELTNDDIVAKIKKLFNLYDASIALNVLGCTTSQITSINNELTRTMGFCSGVKAGVPVNLESTATNALAIKESSRESLIQEKLTALLTNDEQEALSDYIEVEEQKISDDDAILHFTISDEEGYNQSLNLICNEKINLIRDYLLIK